MNIFTKLGELLVILLLIWYQITEINNWNWKICYNVHWNCNCNRNVWISTTLTETVTEKSQLK